MNECDQSATSLDATIRYAGLTTQEMRALLVAMPDDPCAAVVTRQPVLLGGARFAVEIAGLSVAEVHTIAALLHNHVRDVAAEATS